MIVGATGHQKRDGIDWNWVGQTISSQLAKEPAVRAMSSLAEGTDQIFARAALKLGIPVEAVIPLDDYERFFSGRGIATYHQLLKLSAQTSLHWKGDPEHAFLNAGRYIVDRCGVLFAVWDGEAADGIGGTADIVHYALAQGRKVLHFNPCDKSIHEI